MILLIPVLVFVIGLLMWAFSANPKILEIGKIMFWTGLLATLFKTDAMVNLLGK